MEIPDKQNYIPNLDDAIAANKDLENNPYDMALRKLFKQLCPTNIFIEDIIIKCTTLYKTLKFQSSLFIIRLVSCSSF